LQFAAPTKAAPDDQSARAFTEAFQKAFEKAEHMKGLLRQAAVLTNKGDYAGVAALLKQATEDDPTCAICHCDYGVVLNLLGQPESAKIELLKAADLDKNDWRPWSELWTIYDGEGNTQPADLAYQKYVQLRPNLSDAEKSKDHLRAEGFYARAVAYIRQKDYVSALPFLKMCCDQEPSSAKYHGDYGFLLHSQGDDQSARNELRKCIRLDNQYADAWMCLGALYAEDGELKSADEAIERYLALAPKGGMVKIATVLKSEVKNAEEGNSLNSDDYLACVSQEQSTRWPQSKMPLKVCIENGEGRQAKNPQYEKILRQSFADWAAASQGKLSFDYVNQPSDADIIINWDVPTAGTYRPTDIGATTTAYNAQGINKVTITMLPKIPPPESDERVKRIALHEIGHAIGVHGHSPNPADVMYFGAAYTGTAPQLSPRDVKTLRLIYHD
jgi:predicted Zn-dependent protease/Flp pilus assembly protein TadD